MSHLTLALILAIGVVSATTPSLGQSTVTYGGGEGGVDERESSWIAYFDQDARRFIGGIYVNYNLVQWREEYAEELDSILRGEVWRMGKHFWTTLDTNLELDMSGIRVPPGYYYLGLARSPDGETWSLALVEAEVAREKRLDAFNIDLAPIAYSVPLRFERADEIAEELKVLVSLKGAEEGRSSQDGFHEDARITVRFGAFRLTAPVRVMSP